MHLYCNKIGRRKLQFCELRGKTVFSGGDEEDIPFLKIVCGNILGDFETRKQKIPKANRGGRDYRSNTKSWSGF